MYLYRRSKYNYVAKEKLKTIFVPSRKWRDVSKNDDLTVENLLRFCHRSFPASLSSPISYFCAQQKSRHFCRPKKVMPLSYLRYVFTVRLSDIILFNVTVNQSRLYLSMSHQCHDFLNSHATVKQICRKRPTEPMWMHISYSCPFPQHLYKILHSRHRHAAVWLLG